MISLASVMRRAGVIPSKKARLPRANDEITPNPDNASPDAKSEQAEAKDNAQEKTEVYVFGEPSHNWDPQYQPKIKDKVKERKQKREEKRPHIETFETDEDKADGMVTQIRVSRRASIHKRRTQTVCVTMSEEEMALMDDFRATLTMPFSTWAREVLFMAIGKQIPPRPKHR